MDEYRNHELQDGFRKVMFEGAMLGGSSSHRADSPRWTEVRIYRTRAGAYVVEGVGRSLAPNESDRSWVQVCSKPEGVIESLYQYDKDGVRYLTKVARQAIIQSALKDPPLEGAFMTERID